MTSECDVCFETFSTKKKYSSITCYVCNYIACMKCYKIYMNQLAIEQNNYPMCMKCKKIWDYKFILSNIQNSYIKEFNKLHSEVSLNLNLSMLPVYAEKYLDAYKITKINRSSLTINDLRLFYNILS